MWFQMVAGYLWLLEMGPVMARIRSCLCLEAVSSRLLGMPKASLGCRAAAHFPVHYLVVKKDGGQCALSGNSACHIDNDHCHWLLQNPAADVAVFCILHSMHSSPGCKQRAQ